MDCDKYARAKKAPTAVGAFGFCVFFCLLRHEVATAVRKELFKFLMWHLAPHQSPKGFGIPNSALLSSPLPEFFIMFPEFFGASAQIRTVHHPFQTVSREGRVSCAISQKLVRLSKNGRHV